MFIFPFIREFRPDDYQLYNPFMRLQFHFN